MVDYDTPVGLDDLDASSITGVYYKVVSNDEERTVIETGKIVGWLRPVGSNNLLMLNVERSTQYAHGERQWRQARNMGFDNSGDSEIIMLHAKASECLISQDDQHSTL